ncbi:MAG TPA: deoxyuridine 5'-triphosphate nucleotidohydrolase [Lachnospiraceae bacterium]|nr:deoxyuridine 5'-triphosphate nucleotidohydrolase [Lachnospiraceae bacterium]
MTETIKINYLPGAAHMNQEKNSDWVDCFAYEDVTLKKGEYGYVNLGFACQLPEGYEAHLAPRSSTFKHFGVIQTNSTGIIDESFASDSDLWMMPVYAMRDTIIKKGERPCQFRIMKKQPTIQFEEVDKLNNETRGGFGSTGR